MLQYFLMQKKLGDLSQDRTMENYSEMDRLMRERSAEADVAAQRRATEQHGMTMKEIFTRGTIQAANETGLDADFKMARNLEVQGDIEGAKRYYETAFKKALPYIQAQSKLATGKELTPDDVAANLIGGGVGGVEKGTSEAGQNRRSGISAGLERGRQGIDIQKLNFDKEKFNAESGGGTGMTKDQRNAYIDMISDTEKFLIDQGVQGEAVSGNIRALFSSGKTLNPLSAGNQGKALTYLGEIRAQVIGGKPPTPAQVNFVNSVKNVSRIGETGVQPPPAETALAPSAPAAPAQAAPTHTVGERRTVQINGVNATYVWDGTQWVLSK